MAAETILIASDHAGYDLKEIVENHLRSSGYEVVDYGCESADRCDYPDYIHPLAKKVNDTPGQRAVIMCGSGQGVNMTANKYPNVRSALVWTPELATLTRAHNDANILALPARVIESDVALQIVDAFLAGEFEGGRHADRVTKIKP